VSTDLIRVLMVDDDAVSRRMVELSLGSHPGWTVESARDGAGALEVLRTSPFDVILSERTLPDMAGLQFHRRLLQERRLRSIPFLIVSIDSRIENRVVALQAGVDDYLVKPLDATELRARIESHVGRWRRARELDRGRRYLLAGDFSALAFPDLVTTLTMQRQRGVISINTPTTMAEVFIEDGQVVHATFGNLTGVPAFNALLLETGAQFEFTPTQANVSPDQHTLRDSVTSLILEATRQIDERARDAPPIVSSGSAVRKVTSSSDASLHPPRRPATPF
jgi:two-component system, chemotaxis family, chemotaxis protein CheY